MKREHAPQIKIAHPVCDSETYYTTTTYTYVDVAVVRCPSSRVLGKPLLNSELKNHLRKIA